MIDTQKIVDAITAVLAELDFHARICEMALAMDPTHAPFHHQKGKSEGSKQILEALLRGIQGGRFDVEPDTIPAPAPTDDMDDEAPEEEPAKFGVFIIHDDDDDDVTRSVDVDGEFASRTAAWAAIRQDGANGVRYEVRPL